MMRTTVIGSYPLPGWLLFAIEHLDEFGPADRAELQDDAVVAAIHDQVAAGLDVITDGEQTRLDFNLSFYGFLSGIELESAPPRRFGPPAHDQRGRHQITGELAAPDGLGVVEEFERLRRLAPPRADAEGERARAVHDERTARPQRRLPGSLGGDGGAVADRPSRARRRRRRRLHGDHRRRAVDELLRLPRGPGALRRHLQPHRRARRRAGTTVDAPVLRQLPRPRRRPASIRADVPGLQRDDRRRDPCRDGQPRARRARRHRHDRRAPRRRRRHRRREELLRRATGADRRARARVPQARARPSVSRSRPTAGCRRRRAGPPSRSSPTWSPASSRCARSSPDDHRSDRAAPARRRTARRHRRRAGQRRRPPAPVVARPGRLPRAVGRPPPPARPLPVRLADGEVRRRPTSRTYASRPGSSIRQRST